MFIAYNILNKVIPTCTENKDMNRMLLSEKYAIIYYINTTAPFL